MPGTTEGKAILFSEIGENNTQCDCFVTNHTWADLGDSKEFTKR